MPPDTTSAATTGVSHPAISSPVEILAPFLRAVDVPSIISVVFAILFILWVIYTAIASYHLLRYGHRSAVAIPAIITHVLVSFFLALFAVSGLHA